MLLANCDRSPSLDLKDGVLLLPMGHRNLILRCSFFRPYDTLTTMVRSIGAADSGTLAFHLSYNQHQVAVMQALSSISTSLIQSTLLISIRISLSYNVL